MLVLVRSPLLISHNGASLYTPGVLFCYVLFVDVTLPFTGVVGRLLFTVVSYLRVSDLDPGISRLKILKSYFMGLYL